MEEEKKLYPLRFIPITDEYGWGREEFKLADLGYRDSVIAEGWLGGNAISEVMDMYMDRVVGENVFEYYGRQFPYQVKLIRVNGRMPLRVHPEDEIASQRYDLLGKEKLWYVVSAGRDARLMIGFRKDTNASEVYEKCLDSSISDIMNTIAPIEGKAYRIKPGTPHAASGEMLIAEVSESSPLDFCLCSWGEEVSPEEFDESLNLVDAMDFIDYGRYSAPQEDCGHHHGHDSILHKLVDIPQFTVNKAELHDPIHIYSEKFDSPFYYLCLKGEASVQVQIEGIGTAAHVLKEGQGILVPAEVPDFILAPLDKNTVLLETYLEKRESADPYINPEAPEFTDDEDDGCEDEECGCHHHHDHS